MGHNRYDELTSDGDFNFIVNCFIPMNRKNTLFPEQLRALWTALCLHHGVDGGKEYDAAFAEIADAVGRHDAEFARFMSELLDLGEDDDEDD